MKNVFGKAASTFLVSFTLLMFNFTASADVAILQLNTANYKNYTGVHRPVTFVGIVKVRADKVDRFTAIASGVLKTMRAQRGNISYSYAQSLSDPTEFMWIEDWKDGKSLEGHMDSKAVASLVAKAGPLFVTPLNMFILEKK